MKTAIVTSATAEPILLSDAKRHLRVSTSFTDDDSYINSLITAARQEVENYTNRKLMYQRWKVYFDEFPSGESFEIPYPPLRSIPSTGLRYTNSTQSTQTLSSTKWDSDTVSEPGRLVLDYNDDWPTDTLAQSNPISIEFRCGYPTSGASSGGRFVPALIRHAIKLIVSDLYEQRENFIVGQPINSIPTPAKRLLSSYRIKTF